MEGVTFSLRDSLELFEKMNLPVERIIASGGGANSKIWLRIQADIFGKEIVVSDVREQACLGACILAGIGTGMFGDVQEAVRKLVTFKKETYEPDMKAHERYGLTYRQFQKIYDANKELFAANGH
jgi:xylulokinase